ncbi:hypothetical protein C8035_v002444 [Colletotrichum spinosum]|uniref:BTB domain-containing protein n=1 Tax=Colletotrichum spinosum TaxID=1347390 RepID=A0A4R8Q0Y5_9PEZI|nr:hypothetical protein C8035_v002444 [Colletotrichum spinosum]
MASRGTADARVSQIPSASAPLALVDVMPPEEIFAGGDLTIDLLDDAKKRVAAFRVSAPVLQLASTVFSEWIDNDPTIREHRTFTIENANWHPNVLRCILSLLHHTNIEKYKSLTMVSLALVSDCSLNMGLNKALDPWISR